MYAYYTHSRYNVGISPITHVPSVTVDPSREFKVHVPSVLPRKLQNSGMTYLKVAKFWNDRAVYIDKILSL